MTDLIFFLGRFHVVVLHFPIAFILAAITLEWLSRKEGYDALRIAASLLWLASAITAMVTAILGYMHFGEGGFDTTSGQVHRFFGTFVAVATTLVWLGRGRQALSHRAVRVGVALVLPAAVLVTGHSGANLTHGSGYLVEYAPAPIRAFAFEPPRPLLTDVAAADPYLDIVGPMLSRRCTQCHGDDKRQGNLNLASHAAILAGGTEAPRTVVVPGDADGSDLIRRVTLPRDHEDFMPAEGKTPLTDNEIQVLRWWVEAGAPTGTAVSALRVEPQMRTLLAAAAGIGGASIAAAPRVDRVVHADPKLIARLDAVEFLVRQVARDDAALVVGLGGASGPLSDHQLATLTDADDEIAQLSLKDVGATDAHLAIIGRLRNLSHLHLQNNVITDTGVRHLEGLRRLRYLNLYGNRGVTDASLDVLAALPALERVYLWNTGVTQRGAARLRERRPGILIDLGTGGQLTTPRS